MILSINEYGDIRISKLAFNGNIVCRGFVYRDLSSYLLICPPSSEFVLLSAAGAVVSFVPFDALSLPEFPHPARQDTASADTSIILINFFFIVTSFFSLHFS